MRSKPALTYSFLFFLSGVTGLIYELLWVRVLYQSFGSTIQSVTTVSAAPSRTTFAFPKGIMKFGPGFGALL